jgi:hypothetical protein
LAKSRQSGLSFDLPSATPTLQGMFPRASFKDGIKRFKIDESVDFVFACKAGNKLGLMFSHSPREIVGHANVQRTIWLACENVNKEHHVHR